VTASWSMLSAPNSFDLNGVGWLAVSILVFCALLALNVRWPGRKQSGVKSENQQV
jgi:hypothetical protein